MTANPLLSTPHGAKNRFSPLHPLRLALIAAALSLPLVSLQAADDPFAANIRTTEPLSPADELKSFHLPPGFAIQLVAAEPEIAKPINIAFDSRGRLWITQTLEYPFPAKPGVKARDAIQILEDFGPDGHARKITTYAGGLNIPTGVYPMHGGAIAYSIPNIYRLRDNAEGVATEDRDVLYGPFDTTRDTHGMTNGFRRGFDGWLYATHGFNNHSTIRGRDGHEIYMDSGHIWRMRLDGSRVEDWSTGEPNPFGIVFDLYGNLYSCDCSSKPIWQNIRGGIYPHFGRPHDGMGYAPEMMQHLHGSTAIGGLVYIAAGNWPEEFRGNMLVGNPVTCRLDRDRLEDHGSTRLAREMPDFMSTDDPWFRPVYLEMGPDGALYIADFYNRIIGHYEVPLDHPGRDRERGRIWRIVPLNADGSPRLTPIRDLTRESATALVSELAQPNMTLRFLATSELTDQIGAAAIEPVKRAAEHPVNAFQKVHALWVLHRLGALDFSLLAHAAKSEDPVIRTQAIRIAGEMTPLPAEALALVISGLHDADAFARRAAAEALGKHPDMANIRPLLDARAAAALASDDTHLLHTVRLALRDALSQPGAFAKLENLTSQDVQTIGDVCPGVPSEDAAAFLAAHLGREIGWTANALKHVVRYIPDGRIEEIIGAARAAQKSADPQVDFVAAAADAIAQRGTKPGPALHDWAEAAVAGVFANASATPESQQAAAEVCQHLKLADTKKDLFALLENGAAKPKPREAAAAALAALDPAASIETVARIIADEAAPFELRDKCAGTLGGLNLPAARAALLASMATAPQRLQIKLAVAIANDAAGAAELIDNVAAKKVTARILQERGIQDRLNVLNKPELKARAAELTANLVPLNDEVQRLIKTRSGAYNPKTASAERGAQTFQTICIVCHSIHGAGGQVGPPLDGVGARGVERLTEDIFDPSRNVDPAFRYSTVTLSDGTVFNGLFRRDEGAQLVFVDAAGQEVKAAKEKIQSRIESTSSLMPDGFGQAFTPEQYNDLIAFLISKVK